VRRDAHRIGIWRSLLRAAMLQTLVRTAGAVLCTAAVLAAVPAHAGDTPIVIRLYDMATGDESARGAAMRTASAAIASAGIAVSWLDCSRGGEAHPCRTVRNANDLVVRVMPSRGPAEQQQAAAAISSGDGEVQLGFTPIDPSGRGAVIATIYYDVVASVSRRTGIGAHELLGRAIAHEVGHLLLRAPGHGRSGLMRPLWTDEELMQSRPGDWIFSEADRRQVQAAARGSAPSTSVRATPAIDDSSEGEAAGR